jgi:hypothetical protein
MIVIVTAWKARVSCSVEGTLRLRLMTVMLLQL